jgi:hypothetical protein
METGTCRMFKKSEISLNLSNIITAFFRQAGKKGKNYNERKTNERANMSGSTRDGILSHKFMNISLHPRYVLR